MIASKIFIFKTSVKVCSIAAVVNIKNYCDSESYDESGWSGAELVQAEFINIG